MNACVRCGSTEFRPAVAGYGFDRAADRFALLECCRCRLVMLSPLPGAADLERNYDADYYGGGAERKFSPVMEALVRMGNRARAAELVAAWERSRNAGAERPRSGTSAPAGRVLDIGCGRGQLLIEMARRGWECYGTELSAFPAGDGPEEGRRGRLALLRRAADDLPFEDQYFDIVSVWHVLEHMRNPGRTIQDAARTLKPGGILSLAVPNYSSVQRMMFGRHWFHLDLPRHCYHFRKPVLLDWLAEHRLEVLTVRTFSAEQNVFGFVQSALNMVLWRWWPNGFYRLLRGSRTRRPGAAAAAARALAVAGFAATAAAVLPVALLESAVSAMMGRGATLMVCARRSHS